MYWRCVRMDCVTRRECENRLTFSCNRRNVVVRKLGLSAYIIAFVLNGTTHLVDNT